MVDTAVSLHTPVCVWGGGVGWSGWVEGYTRLKVPSPSQISIGCGGGDSRVVKMRIGILGNVTGSYYRSEQHVQQPSYHTGK